MPRGGFYLWCQLPEGIDSAELARYALDRDVVLAPGNVFSISQGAGGFMRFNVAQSRDQRLIEVLHQGMESLGQGARAAVLAG